MVAKLKEGISSNELRISRRLFDYLGKGHRNHTKYLVGRLLTIVDGISADQVQRKAIKDMVEEVVYRESNVQDENIRSAAMYLAEILQEKCDWVIRAEGQSSTEYNPLRD